LTALSVAGWLAAAALAAVAVRLRRRLALVADVEHELRGPLTAIELGMGRLPGGAGLRDVLASELARARAALDDLTAVRSGRRAGAAVPSLPVPLQALVASCARSWSPPDRTCAVLVDWRAGPATIQADPGRVSQALGNLVSNAVEHGTGPVRIRVWRIGEAVRIEVLNRPRLAAVSGPREGARGRGLRIAARAARDAGGTLSVAGRPGRVAAVLDLPAEP
jgi:signal transduction histidine kinase